MRAANSIFSSSCDILKGQTQGPVAQLGARFHGMEEVVSSNLTRSTKTFQRVSGLWPSQYCPLESNSSPNLDAGLRHPQISRKSDSDFMGPLPSVENPTFPTNAS